MIRKNYTFGSVPQRGFSLVETLIVVALTVLILGVLVYLFLGFGKTYQYIEAKFEVAGSASTLVEQVSNSVRQSSGIISSRAFSGTNYLTNSTTMILAVPTVNSSGSIVFGSYDYMLFYKSGSDFYWVVDANGSSARPSGTKKLSNVVQSLAFTYNNSDVTAATRVDIDIQTAKTVKTQSVDQRVRNQIYLRNI